jgi:hypothetical protein
MRSSKVPRDGYSDRRSNSLFRSRITPLKSHFYLTVKLN